jgi:uncharacterized membrane protein YbaN (DUF454 family)
MAFVGMGFLGYALPGLPGTPFLLAALYCFKRSSRRFEDWLLHHRWFGPLLSDWETSRAISARTKRTIYYALWASLLASAFLWGKPYGWAILLAVGVGVTLYVRSRPEGRE